MADGEGSTLPGEALEEPSLQDGFDQAPRRPRDELWKEIFFSRDLVPGQPADFISRSLTFEVSSSDAPHTGQQHGRWVSALEQFFIQTLATPPHSARAYVGRAEARRFRAAPIKAPR
eukprot:5227318-Pyramimonas_sp.AAC.1